MEKKSKEIKLVKVNSSDDGRRYDAYGYLIKDKKAETPVTEQEPDDMMADEPEYTAPRSSRGTDLDARAAIESGMHNRTHRDFSKEYDEQRAAARANAQRPSQVSRTQNSNGQNPGAQNSHARNASSGTSTRTAEEERAARAAKAAREAKAAEKAKKDAAKAEKEAAKAEKEAAREEKAREKSEKQQLKEQKKQEARAKKEAEENRELTAHERRLQIYKKQRREIFLGVLKVVAVLAVIAVIVLIVHFSGKSRNRINTQYISKGYIEDEAEGTLTFLRKELPVYSSFSGIFVPNVNEGDRVSKNTIIGYVTKPEYSDSLKELKEIEDRITAAQKAASYVLSSKSSEMLALEDAIDTSTDKLAELAMAGNLLDYSDCAAELNELMERKNELLLNADTQDTYIAGLQKQRNALLNKISSYMYEVRAAVSGTVSFNVDNLQDRVSMASESLGTRIGTTNFASTLSSTLTFAEWADFSIPDSELSTCRGTEVSNGSIVARIAPEISYYVTMELNDPSKHSISNGRKVTVYAPEDNLSFEATTVGVYYCGERAMVVLEADRCLASSISVRKVKGSVIFTHIEGFKVPLRALTDWDSAGLTARITLVRSGFVEYVHVNVLGRNNDYAIINSRSTLDDSDGLYVRENDEYVVNYDKVYEGQGV